MALIIEDGSVVPGANSYVTVAEIREFAAARGITLPVADADVEVLAVNGFDYVESFNHRFQGYPTSALQQTSFPRTGLVWNSYYWPSDSIPDSLKKAQIQAAIESLDLDLMPMPQASIKKEKIDVLETEYATPLPTGVVLDSPRVMAHLERLFRVGGGFRVRVVRG